MDDRLSFSAEHLTHDPTLQQLHHKFLPSFKNLVALPCETYKFKKLHLLYQILITKLCRTFMVTLWIVSFKNTFYTNLEHCLTASMTAHSISMPYCHLSELKMSSWGRLKMREWKMRYGQNCKGMENAGVEKAGVDSRGGNRTGKCGSRLYPVAYITTLCLKTSRCCIAVRTYSLDSRLTYFDKSSM